MTEIRVKDVFPVYNGLFTAIAAAAPTLDFPKDLDLLLLSKCGNRCITPIVEMLLDGSGRLSAASLDRLAVLIVSEYGEAWDRIKTALEIEYNPLSSSTYHEEETTDTEGETVDENSESTSKVMATASQLPSDMLSDGGSSSEAKVKGSNTSKVKRTLDRTNNGTSYKSSELLQSEIKMRIDSRFTAQVVTDVKNYIAMMIY